MIAASINAALGQAGLMLMIGGGDDAGTTHMNGISVWMLISMIAFSVFLLSIAWTLMRPTKEPERSAADIAAQRFAHGEIGEDEFKRTVRDSRPPHG